MSFEAYLKDLTEAKAPLAVSKLAELSSLGPSQTPLLRDAWAAMEVQRRQRVIKELSDLAEDNVELNFDAVFLVALTDSDEEVRREAVKGLWEHEDSDLVDPLAGMLEDDPAPDVRAEAALALGRFILQAEMGTLSGPDAERAEGALRRTVEDAAETEQVRARALESLGARSEPWVRALIEEAFEGPDRRLRLSALHAMGRSCDPDWLSALFVELESEDAETRFEAATACGAIADEEATDQLLPLLYDEDLEVQEAAISALGQIGGPQAKEALTDLIEGADERVREAVVSALAELELVEDPLGLELGE